VVKTGGSARAIPKKRESLSAVTSRTMEQIAEEKSAVWGAHAPSRAPFGASPKGGASGPRGRRPQHARRVRSPEFVKSMKAAAVTELPQEGDWIHEVKWDGYCALGGPNRSRSLLRLPVRIAAGGSTQAARPSGDDPSD
jgi:ATP-dependent DNA ligase